MNKEVSCKRVWHLSSNRWNSAITEYALSSAKALLKCGWDSYFSPLEGSKAHERAKKYGFNIEPFRSFELTGIFHFLQAYRKIKPSVIIAYGGLESTLLKFLPKNDPLLKYRFRGEALRMNGLFAKQKIKFGMNHFDGIITPSRYISNQIDPFVDQKIVDIILGCDTDRFYRVSDMKEKRPEMLILGRFDPIKGHDYFFRLTKKVLSSWDSSLSPKPILHILGEPANISVSQLHNQAREAGLVESFDYKITAARVDNIHHYLSKATLGVIPSLGSEVICRVGEEFLLCGTPVLVSGVGSLKEILFPNAGASYDGLSDEGCVEMVRDLLLKSFNEEDSVRAERADMAKDLFSLECMGRRLGRFILS